MVVIVGAEAFELFTNGHDADGLAGAGGTANGDIESRGMGSGGGGLLGALEKTDAELVPGFALRIVHGRESVMGAGRERGLDAGDPVEGNLLPEGDVPELLINGVGGAHGFFVGKFRGKSFEDAGRRRGGAVPDQDLFEFGHGALSGGRGLDHAGCSMSRGTVTQKKPGGVTGRGKLWSGRG